MAEEAAQRQQRDQPAHTPRAVWPWAAGAILATLLVIAATFGGRYLVSHAQRIPQVAAQFQAPLTVVATIHPQAGAALFALDPNAHHLVALADSTERTCPPVGACPPAPAHSDFVTLDDATGAQLVTWPLAGPAAHAAHATLLLIDVQRNLAYAISPGHVDMFSTISGAYLGGYALHISRSPVSGAFDSGGPDSTSGRLILLAGTTLLAIDAASGRILARQSLAGQSGAFSADGPVVDSTTRLIDVLLRPTQTSNPVTLAEYSAETLAPLGAYTLAPGTRLGPLNAGQQILYLLDGDGSVSRLSLANLSVTGSGATPRTAPSLQGAHAIGWDDTRNRLFEAQADDTRALDVATGQPLGALPLASNWPGDTPLPVDATRGLIYL
ncbi:MAG TPA: hypothetical protein VKQ36_11115, partial [Ktedonobacterales bacterium]|nr:hypothetical protein [Ktedonobacterales bacterium]